MFKANVHITLRKSILDPKGKAAHNALHNLGMKNVNRVRIGKFIELDIDAKSEEEARDIAENACSQLLANEVMEDFDIEIKKIST
ncbi:MAG: phosphoribosylformylglycinamidine synthase subunit PurS [Bacteroidetes bacterium]|jgi:phosphoribosylformylglycinamidine synthase|nr:phosphoribosylformylglycinamidine synthase subunit PurS [Bacteroidota bacterium]